MQDIHSIESGGGGGRLFAGGGDRRLRPHHHQDLKCPRCESLNTKFCYYNNYNQSQPRHFCKSCRRYWTKGGVLRNVPVGGGVRKTKRSKPKSKATAPRERKSSNSENSSSDSSSLTANTTSANTTATATPITTTKVSWSNLTNSKPMTLLNFSESSSRFFNIPHSSTPSTTFDPLMMNQSSAGNMLSEMGKFTSLMTSSTDQLPLGFNMAMATDISSLQLHQQNTEHVKKPNELQWTHTDAKMQETGSAGFIDPTAEIGLSGLESRRSNSGLAATEDWQGGADQALFDLTGTVDQSYWSQSQWNDHDRHLNYLP